MTTVQRWYVDSPSGVRMPDGVTRVPVDRCIIASWNPNQQDPATFRNLVDSIKEHGFIDIPQVVPLATPEMRAEYLDESHDEGEYWLIAGGAHRKDAAKMLDMTLWPVIIIDGWSADMVKMQNMRLNSLKGKVNPDKFYKLYGELKAKGYGDDLLKAQMGLVQRNAMKRLLKQVTSELPVETQKLVEARADEIHNQDDLGRVLKELFSKHGDSLPVNYMVFEFGKKTHYWIRMDRDTKDALDKVAALCLERTLDINRVLGLLFTDEAGLLAATGSALAHAKVEDDIFA